MDVRKPAGVFALLLVWGCSIPLAAPAGTVEKRRLDPMNIQYEGVDVNGDEFDDAICINLVTGETRLLLGRPDGKPERVRMEKLGPHERAALPDLVVEVDLDGDQLKDLVVANLAKLAKASGDEALFVRVLEHSVYFGQQGDTFKTLRLLGLPEEQRALLIETAKKTLLGPKSLPAVPGQP